MSERPAKVAGRPGGEAARGNGIGRLRYLPYDEAANAPNVVVDGSPNAATVLTLTHWPGIASPADLVADLSAQMAFRYLDAGADRHGGAGAVTNNHFDQDGLVSVFALTEPERALPPRDLLVDLAAAGDFATYRSRDAARLSMVVAGFTDPDRSPLGSALQATPADATALLYTELLGRLPELLADPGGHRELWGDEDSGLDAAEQAIATGAVGIVEDPELDLAVVTVPESVAATGGHRFAHRSADGLHPMAVNNATERCCIVQLRASRYDVTYRYESWVQYRSRLVRRRVDLAPLAAELNAFEPGGAPWIADPISDLTPRLHLAPGEASALDPARFLTMLRRHLGTSPSAWDPFEIDDPG